MNQPGNFPQLTWGGHFCLTPRLRYAGRTICVAFHAAGSLTPPPGTLAETMYWAGTTGEPRSPIQTHASAMFFRIATKPRKIILATLVSSQCAVYRLKTYSRCLSMRECAVISQRLKWVTTSGVPFVWGISRDVQTYRMWCHNVIVTWDNDECVTRRSGSYVMWFRWRKWGPRHHRFVTWPPTSPIKRQNGDPSLT